MLPASRELCAKWAEVSWSARRKGCPSQTADAWNASALYYHNPLITHNATDYAAVDGLQLLTAAGL